MKKVIYFYSSNREYFEFSNFSEHPIVINGKEYPTNEHYFQSMKFLPTEMVFLKEYNVYIPYQEIIRYAKTPKEAKRLGSNRNFKIHPNWDTMRIEVMRECVRAKFQQHPSLRELLLSTGDAILVEDSPTDYFWGCGKNRTGKNMLGKILMEVRGELRNASIAKGNY
jgi:N-glycosidase YbiA